MVKPHKRKPHFKKNGKLIRGTYVKPKYFKKKIVVDKDFDTKHTSDEETGEMTGRENTKKDYERVAVLRLPSGEIVGRTKSLPSHPYPKSYPIFTKQKGKLKRKNIPVVDWND